MGGANNVLGSHAGLTSFSWGHESVVAAAVRRCCLARRMLPLLVSLALSLVARLPVPLLIPVLEFLWHAPAVWVDEHQHIFSRFFDLGHSKRSMPGLAADVFFMANYRGARLQGTSALFCFLLFIFCLLRMLQVHVFVVCGHEVCVCLRNVVG